MISGRREVRPLPRPPHARTERHSVTTRLGAEAGTKPERPNPFVRHSGILRRRRAGSEPALRRFESVSRDLLAHARLAQRQRQPAQTRFGRSSNLRARTKRQRADRVRLPRYQRGDAGSTPAGRARSSTVEHHIRAHQHVRGVSSGRPSRRSTVLHTERRGFDSRPLHDRQPPLARRSRGASRRLMVISRVVQAGETAASKTASVRVRIPPREPQQTEA